jgi:hypothetical protein
MGASSHQAGAGPGNRRLGAGDRVWHERRGRGPVPRLALGPAGPSGPGRCWSWPPPAGAGVWSGWVGIAQKTGFSLVSPLPGILPSLHLDTSITPPVGVEAYAAYALRAWLAREDWISDRTRLPPASERPAHRRWHGGCRAPPCRSPPRAVPAGKPERLAACLEPGGQPGSHRRLQRGGIHRLQDPADGRLIRRLEPVCQGS